MDCLCNEILNLWTATTNLWLAHKHKTSNARNTNRKSQRIEFIILNTHHAGLFLLLTMVPKAGCQQSFSSTNVWHPWPKFKNHYNYTLLAMCEVYPTCPQPQIRLRAGRFFPKVMGTSSRIWTADVHWNILEQTCNSGVIHITKIPMQWNFEFVNSHNRLWQSHKTQNIKCTYYTLEVTKD